MRSHPARSTPIILFLISFPVGSARSRAKKTQSAPEWQAHSLSASASARHPTTCEHESNKHRYPFLPYLSLHCMSGSVSYRVCAKLTWRRRKHRDLAAGKILAVMPEMLFPSTNAVAQRVIFRSKDAYQNRDIRRYIQQRRGQD